MTKDQLKIQIDTDITNKTSARSITPLNVGKNMKDVINLIPDITNKVDKVTNKSLVSDTEIAKLVNLDNTKDIDKPVSTAQQAAIDAQINDSIALSDPTIAIVPTGNVHILGVSPGTYSFWGGMVIPANHTGTLRRVGGVYSVSLTAFTDINKILPWVAQSYLINDQVNYLGKDWVSNAATVAGDVPGTSTKWVERLSGYIPVNSNVELNQVQFDGVAFTDAYDNLIASLESDGVHIKQIVSDDAQGFIYIIDSDNNLCAYCDSTGNWNFNESKTQVDKKIIRSKESVISIIDEAKLRDFSIDFPSLNIPKYIFALENQQNFWDNFNRTNYMQRLYREGLTDQKIPLLLNGFESIPINYLSPNVSNSEAHDVPIAITADGYHTQNINVSFIKTKSAVLSSSFIGLLSLGDSLSSQSAKDENHIGDYDFADIAKMIFEKLNRDETMYRAVVGGTPNLISSAIIGTQAIHTNTFTYNGSSITIKGGVEGRGGWTTPSYLRHCTNTIAEESSINANWLQGATAWASLGLGKKIIWNTTSEANGYGFYTTTPEAYTGTQAQRALIRSTPHGYYLPDLDINLWTALKNRMGYSATLGSSYSTGQWGVMMTALKDLIEVNPVNPFFDVTVARATGTQAFSIIKYVSRYRTIDDLGVRLYGVAGGQAYYNVGLSTVATGYTIGTKVTNTLDYDVCTPTHIVLNLMGNDHLYDIDSSYGSVGVVGFPSKTVAELNLMAAICKTELSLAKIAIPTQRRLGTLFPSSDYFYRPIDTWLGKMVFEISKLLYNSYITPIVDRVSVVPTGITLPTTSTSNSAYYFDFLTGKTIIKTGDDIAHYGYNGILSVGYDIASWIAYTKS